MEELRSIESDLAGDFTPFLDQRAHYEWGAQLADVRIGYLGSAELEANGDLARALGSDYLSHDASQGAEFAVSQLDEFDSGTGTFIPGAPNPGPNYVNDPLSEDPYTIVNSALRDECGIEPWLTQEDVQSNSSAFVTASPSTSLTPTSLPDEPTTTTTVTASTPVVSFDYTDAEGWHYTGTIDWVPEHAHTFDLDISSSPPGRAQVAVGWTGAEDPYPGNYDGPEVFPDNPGRPDGPPLTIDCCGLIYHAPSQEVIGGTDRVDSSGTCEPDIILSPDLDPALPTEEVLGEADPGVWVLNCEARGYDGSSSAFGGSNDDEFDESAAQAIVDAASSTPLGWSFSLNQQSICEVFMTLDGEIVLDNPTFWRENCGSATFELERAP